MLRAAYPLEETNILDALEKNLRAEHAILMLVGAEKGYAGKNGERLALERKRRERAQQ